MSRCVVTGAAGFIGSHLCEALLAAGHDVVGVDAFIPYYPRPIKEANLAGSLAHPRFQFREVDLRTDDLEPLLDGCEVLFHLAAMAGLMKSWSEFDLYASCNLLATKRLIEAARDRRVGHVIHASTSSIYGHVADGPEDTKPAPISPYGVTKLAAEHLCHAFEVNFGLPVTILRYFSVYGPRQRPDMAYNMLVRALLRDEAFPLCGNGEQTRSNTYVADAVRATLLAMERREDSLGQTFNVGGGEVVSLNRVIGLLEDISGRKLRVERRPPRPGDQQHTAANIDKARAQLGYQPSMRVADGLRAQWEWQSKTAD